MIEFLTKRTRPFRKARRVPRIAVLVLVAAIMAQVLTGCYSTTTKAPTTDVHMGIMGATQPLWRYVAQERERLLTPAGYLVSFTSYASESDLKKAFVNKEIDVMATLPPALPGLVQEGVDAQYFLPIAWLKEGYPIIVPVESPIRSPADLVDRKLSTFAFDHPGLAYWQAFILANYGQRLTDKTNMVVSTNPAEYLLNGQADAATVDSVAWSQLKGTGLFRVVSDLATEWAKLSGSSRPLIYGGYVARKDWLEKNSTFVDHFIRINYDALQLYQKDQKSFLQTASAYSGTGVPPLSVELLQPVADYLGMSQVGPDRAYLTESDVADYDKVYQLLSKTGYLKSSPAPAVSYFYLNDARPKN